MSESPKPPKINGNNEESSISYYPIRIDDAIYKDTMKVLDSAISNNTLTMSIQDREKFNREFSSQFLGNVGDMDEKGKHFLGSVSEKGKQLLGDMREKCKQYAVHAFSRGNVSNVVHNGEGQRVIGRVPIFSCGLKNGNELNVEYDEKILVFDEATRNGLKTSAVGQELLSGVSEDGTINDALSVSLSDKNGNKTLVGIAAGGIIYNSGKNCCFVTTTRKFSSNQEVTAFVSDQSTVAVYKIDNIDMGYNHIFSAGINNGNLDVAAGIEHKEGTGTLNAEIGVSGDGLEGKIQGEGSLDLNTKWHASGKVTPTGVGLLAALESHGEKVSYAVSGVVAYDKNDGAQIGGQVKLRW